MAIEHTVRSGDGLGLFVRDYPGTLVRFSVGLEGVGDLRADLLHALSVLA